MQSAPSQAPDFLTSMAQRRQALLHHAGKVMLDQSSQGTAPAREVMLSQCLLASLEELKLMEEEFVAHTDSLRAAHLERQQKIQFLTALFEMAPCPLILTTTRGVILNVNHAAGDLTTRSPYYLEGKPISTLVAKEKRDEFRAQCDRVIEVGGVTNWQFMLDRQTNVPVRVSATVQIIPGVVGDTQSLYWAIREA